MSDSSDSSTSSGGLTPPELESPIQEVVDAFVKSLQAGERPDRSIFEQRHPALAPYLGRRLAWVELIREQAQGADAYSDGADFPVGDAQGAPEVPSGSTCNIIPFPPEGSHRFECPQCGHAIRLVHWEVSDVTCGGCGSTFRVAALPVPGAKTPPFPTQIGRFKVESLLGRGSFGTVFRAFDPELRRTVAIKVPRRGFFSAEEEQQRFLTEARSVARLRHAHIVQVYEVGSENGSPYLVCEFIDGLTLEEMASRRKLGFREVAELVAEVAEAVDFAHREKVIHRDLKPSNVLLDQQRRPYVTDFGLARYDDPEITITVEGDVIGTPAYMSPEQAQGMHSLVCPASDVYSLGVVLYRLLSGEIPFRGSKQLTLTQVVHMEPRPLRQFNDVIPLDLETITLKAMSKEVDKRYSTAAELAADLRRWLQGVPIVARPVSRAERLVRWSRRNPLPAGLIAVIACLVTFVVFGAVGVAVHQAKLRQEADTARRQANEHERQTRAQLVKRLVQQGASQFDGDPLSAALPFVTALSLDPKETSPGHRLRMASILRAAPPLVRLWNYGPGLRRTVVAPDSRHVAVGGTHGIAVWDLTTNASPAPTILDAGDVVSLEFDALGERLAAGSHDKGTTVWSVPAGELLASRQEGPAGIRLVAWSPSGDRLATAATNGDVTILNAGTGAPTIRVLPHGQAATVLKFSPDATQVFVGLGTRVSDPGEGFLYDVTTGDRHGTSVRHRSAIRAADFSATGQLLVTTADDGDAQVWQRETLAPLGPVLRHPPHCLHARFSPDGKFLWTASSSGVIRRWNVGAGESDAQVSLPNSEHLEAFDLSDDGRFLAASGILGSAMAWCADSLEPVVSRLPHGRSVVDLKVLPGGRRIVTGTPDGAVRIWDLAAGAFAVPKIPHIYRSRARFSDGGRLVLAVDDRHTIQTWAWQDQASPVKVGNSLRHPSEVTAFAVDPQDESRLVSGSLDRKLRFWDRRTGHTFKPDVTLETAPLNIVFSPAGETFLCSLESGRIAVGDSGTGTIRIFPGHEQRATGIAVTDDGKWFATASRDKTLLLWNREDLDRGPAMIPLDSPVNSVEFLPDGSALLAGCDSGFVARCPLPWGVGGTATLHRIGPPIIGIAVSPEGGRFAAVTPLDDFVIRDSSSFAPLARIAKTDAVIRGSALFDKASKRLIVAGGGEIGRPETSRHFDGFVRVYDPDTGFPLTGKMTHRGTVDRIRVSPEGSVVLACGAGGARIWSLAGEARPLTTLRDLAELYSSHQIDPRGLLIPLNPDELVTRFERVRGELTVRPEAIAEWEKEWGQEQKTPTQPD